MRLTIKTKLGLYIGLLLSLGTLFGLVTYIQAQAIDQRVREVTEVVEPTSAAAFEMEINLIGTGFALLGYLHDRDPLHLERLRDDESDFEAYQQIYLQLADFPGSGELARRIETGYAQFRDMADELIAIEDEQTEKMSKLLANFDRLDEILDEQIQVSIDTDTPEGSRKLRAALEMEINTNGIAKGLGNFLRTHKPQYELRVQKDEQDFKRYLEIYRNTQLSPQEQLWASEIEVVFGETVELSEEVIALDKVKEETLERFVQIRRELDVVLDDEIQAITTMELAAAKDAVHASVSQIDLVIILALVASLLIALLAGFVVARNITRPVGQLVEATRAVGRGDLSHRVNIRVNDEFGILGESFNHMVEDLQRSNAELEALNSELDQRVAQRTSEASAAEARAVKAFEELKLTQNSLVQSEKLSAIGELVAGVAHELNNPLTGVLGFSELLLRADLDPDSRQSVKWIAGEARRAADIVQNLLAFARKHDVRATRLNLNQLVAATLGIRSYDFRVSNIEVAQDLTPDLPEIMADANQIQTVLLNLVSNAQFAMTDAHGRGTLRVSTEQVDEMVRVVISDDGPGMKPEELSKVFDPFFTTKEVGTGTGLGLSICHGIVAEHGGRIWVESEYGKGAAFYLEFPVATDDPEGKGDSERKPEEQPTTRSGMRVLVIDDEPVIRDLVETTLGKAGHLVDVRNDAKAALDLIDDTNYDLMLVDIKMPGMDGEEFYRLLSGMSPTLADRVVFMTGDTVSRRTRKFLDWADRPVIEKPFDIETLESLVAHQLLAYPVRVEGS